MNYLNRRTMDNKQTAVEWIEDELSKLNSAVVIMGITQEKYHIQRVHLWEKAKAMEGEEHRRIASKAREEGWQEGKYGVSRW